MFMGQRIGLFGGTFDPPHMGHLRAALAAQRAFLLHRLLFVVANDPWQKSTERSLTEACHRLAMVRMLVEGVEGVEASDLEILRGGPSYTIETVNELRDQGNEVILVVGADTAAGLDTWERASELRELVEVAVVDRPGCVLPELKGWRFQRVVTESPNISSSGVRDLVGDQSSTRDSVPAAISDYILSQDLYQLDWSENQHPR